MKYKLTSKDGKVSCLLRSGKDLVRNNMSVWGAQHIIEHGKSAESDVKGYPIYVDNKWYFEGEEIPCEKPIPSI